MSSAGKDKQEDALCLHKSGIGLSTAKRQEKSDRKKERA